MGNQVALLLINLTPILVFASPIITSISPIMSKGNQTIVIKGSGFGALQPYDGDSDYIRVSNLTTNWNAGSTRDWPSDWVTLNISLWTDTEIVISGFTGWYDSFFFGWVLNNGDKTSVQIWDAKNGDDPAKCTLVVGNKSPKLCELNKPELK